VRGGAGGERALSPAALTALVAIGFAVVVLRRRSAGVALVAAQSLLLGALALGEAGGASSALWLPAGILVVRGLALPGLLALAIVRTREPRRVASERFALPRLTAAVAVTLAAVALVPPFGLEQAGAESAAVALVTLGIVIAAARRAVLFQAIGFIVAENGIFVAGLSVHGGMPAIIELGLLFDLVVAIAVAAVFGTRIHQEFGSGDTALLRRLRD
jgi:hydrogenase-4 component E